jgi:hypothetical protein
VSQTIKRFSVLTGQLGRVSLKLSISKNLSLHIAKMTKALLSMAGAGMARLYLVPYGILVFSCRFGSVFQLRLLLTKQAMFKRELLAMRDADVFLLGFALRLFII